MKCNKNKIKQNCGDIVYSDCVRYELGVSENSELSEGCLSISETTQDIYNQIDIIDSKLDMSSINNDCITFTDPKTPLSVITQIYEKVCQLEDTISSQAELIATLQSQIEELQQNPC